MSIKHGLLALLDQGPRYGYQLRSEFEARTGSTWPLNVGQVYTTLGRLDRDGLVEPDGEDADGHVFYRITESGRVELRAWFEAPVSRTSPPRDELAIKLAMAVTVPGIDVSAVVQGQRAHTLRALQDYTRLKTRAGEDDMAWQLVLESLIFHAEAEVRWLDHCEARLARRAAERVPDPVPEAPAPTRGRKARR
ncbi:PadR family transcriptional regulator [Embleya sp. NBC_00896]|uniref:PadR family transcriptional regulator n=1 Tax=Embleya sp. NBC_00896 TaxID=2975961 RepID=UPI003869FEA9|nr:PadR family transcriptional regulator [Embleya sp. NBC_00896]